jgi:hypothetical protein
VDLTRGVSSTGAAKRAGRAAPHDALTLSLHLNPDLDGDGHLDFGDALLIGLQCHALHLALGDGERVV